MKKEILVFSLKSIIKEIETLQMDQFVSCTSALNAYLSKAECSLYSAIRHADELVNLSKNETESFNV